MRRCDSRGEETKVKTCLRRQCDARCPIHNSEVPPLGAIPYDRGAVANDDIGLENENSAVNGRHRNAPARHVPKNVRRHVSAGEERAAGNRHRREVDAVLQAGPELEA